VLLLYLHPLALSNSLLLLLQSTQVVRDRSMDFDRGSTSGFLAKLKGMSGSGFLVSRFFAKSSKHELLA
jgi:hypothetical protein